MRGTSGELGGEVGEPEDVDGLGHAVVGEGVALDHAGVDAGGDAVLAGDLEDDAHLVEALGHADRLAARAAHRVARDALADADELAGGEELVELLGRGLGAPLDLPAQRCFRSVDSRAAGDELVGVALDQLLVELVGHAKCWQEDAHVDAVALHVVEQPRRVVVRLQLDHY